MTANATRGQVPLQIQFIDPQKPIKVGREIRFEVVRADRPDERVPFEQLDFAFAPVLWGAVQPGADAGTGIVKVVAIAKAKDVYDRPKYELSATFKARGDAALEAGNLFALAMAPPEVELRFYLRDDDPTTDDRQYDPFDPQQQQKPLQSSDFVVDPPHAADIFERDGRFFARILTPSLVGTLTVTFPNGDEARLRLDVRDAGRGPEELPSPEGEADDGGGALVPPPAAGAGGGRAEPARASEPPARTATPAQTAPEAPALAPARPPAVAPPPAASAPAQAAPSASARLAATGVDPSLGLRTAMQQLRREVDAALADGLVPTGTRQKLQQRVKFFRDAAKGYRGPDVAQVQEFFERTLGSLPLEG